jgi:hypothetical protein
MVSLEINEVLVFSQPGLLVLFAENKSPFMYILRGEDSEQGAELIVYCQQFSGQQTFGVAGLEREAG